MGKDRETEETMSDEFENLPGKVLTVREVAAYLRVHSSTIYRLLKKGELPAFRIGSDWRFMADQIDQWRADAEAAGGPLESGSQGKAAK